MELTPLKSKFPFEILFGTLALFAGGLIYVIFRPNHLLMFTWFDWLGMSNNIGSLRDAYGDASLYSWVKYNLPAALWLFAYLFIMHNIWKKDKSRFLYWTYILNLPIIAIASEILQYFNLFAGTFDILDLTSYIVALLTFLLYRKLCS